jgi:hypothetical protein
MSALEVTIRDSNVTLVFSFFFFFFFQRRTRTPWMRCQPAIMLSPSASKKENA